MKTKISCTVFWVATLFLSFVGAHKMFMLAQNAYAAHWIGKIEATRQFDPDLQYFARGGKPIFWVKPQNTATLFFLEGFRTQSPGGMYESFLRDLHENQGVNIIVPIYGLQSSPFHLRNREWNFREDLRTATQIYDAYTANLPINHRIIIAAQSFGTLPALTILAKTPHKPFATVLLSPLNSGLEFRVSGELAYQLSKQTWWLRYIVPFVKTATSPERASPWDIVNEETNKMVLARNDGNPEDSAQFGVQIEESARWLELSIIPQLKGHNISIFYGDRDLYFSEIGFQRLASKLSEGGNNVVTHKLPNSGHIVLLDNSAHIVQQEIALMIGNPNRL